jgi:hypothetical protein
MDRVVINNTSDLLNHKLAVIITNDGNNDKGYYHNFNNLRELLKSR